MAITHNAFISYETEIVDTWPTWLEDYNKRIPILFNLEKVSKTLSDDFSSDNCEKNGTGMSVTNGTLRFEGTKDGNKYISRDLTSVNDKYWSIRFYLDISSFSNVVTNRIFIGLSDKNNKNAANSQDFIGMMIQSQANKFYIKSSQEEVLETTTVGGESRITMSVSQNYYVEINRLSATKYRLVLYYDKDYSQVADIIEGTCSSDISDLRYFVVENGNTGDTGDAINGRIDSLEFYDGTNVVQNFSRPQTADIEEVFDYSDQSEGDAEWSRQDVTNNYSRYDHGNERLKFDNRLDNSNDSISFDLGYSLSNKWIIDFKVEYDILSPANYNTVYVGMSNFDKAKSSSSSQTFIGMAMNYWIGNNVKSFTAHDTRNASLQVASDEDSHAGALALGVYYVRIVRWNSDKYSVMVYKNEDRTDLVVKLDGNCSSTHEGLRYFVMRNFVTTGAGRMLMYIKDLKFYNKIDTVYPEIVKNEFYSLRFKNETSLQNITGIDTPSINEDFSSLDSESNSDDKFPSSDETKIDVNRTDDRIWFDVTAHAGYSAAMNHDLQKELGGGFLASKKWIFRSKIVFTEMIRGNHNPIKYFMMGLSREDKNNQPNNNKNFLGISFEVGSDSNKVKAVYCEDQNYDNGSKNLIMSNQSDGTFYIELIRDKKVFKVNLFSDSNYSTSLGTATINNVIAENLQHLYFGLHSNNLSNSDMFGQIENYKFWNGISDLSDNSRMFIVTDELEDDTTTEFASHVRRYNSTNGDLEIDVKIPEIETGVDKKLFLYYSYSKSNPNYQLKDLVNVPGDSIFGKNNDQAIETFASYSTQNEADVSYIPSHTGGTRIQVSPQFNCILGRFTESTNTIQAHCYKDLKGKNINDDAWIFKFRINSTVVNTHSAENVIYVGLSNNTGNSTDSQNFLGMSFRQTNRKLHAVGRYASSLGAAGGTYSQGFGTGWDQGNSYWIIRRLSRSTLLVSRYSDSNYTTLVEEHPLNVSENIVDLRYLKVAIYGTSPANSLDFGIHDMEFLEGVNGDRIQSTYNENYKNVLTFDNNLDDLTYYENSGTGTSITYSTKNSDVGVNFNGTTSKIDYGIDDSINELFKNGGIINVTIYPINDGESDNGNIVRKWTTGGWKLFVSGESGGKVKLNFAHKFTTTDGVWQTSNAVIPINEVTHVGVIYDDFDVANDPEFIINGIRYVVGNGITRTSTPSGYTVRTNADKVLVGNDDDSSETFNGYIGDLVLANGRFTSLQLIAKYNASLEGSKFATLGVEQTQG